NVIMELLKKTKQENDKQLKKKLLQAVGVAEANVSGKEILASGTSYDTAVAFQSLLPMDLQELHTSIKESQLEFTKGHLNLIKGSGNIRARFTQLKAKGIIIGVVTADDAATTALALEKLRIEDDVHFVAAADLYAPKPSPESFHVFCKKFQLKPEEIAMVGDTTVDLKFARNSHAGYAVGVLSGTGTKEELYSLADYIVLDID